jgi:hypothetical protein
VIREAIAAQLAGKTSAADRVFPTRDAPWRRLELPGISVYANEEGSQDLGNGEGDRTCSVSVLGLVSPTENTDDALDAFALEIEQAMSVDTTFGGAVNGSWYTGARLEIGEEQGRPVGAVRLTFNVKYVF